MGLIEAIFTKDRLLNGNREDKPRKKVNRRRKGVIASTMKAIWDEKNRTDI